MLLVDLRLESVRHPWCSSGSRDIVPQARHTAGCVWPPMHSLFHEAFLFQSAVVDSLSAFQVEAVASFSCVHSDERGFSPFNGLLLDQIKSRLLVFGAVITTLNDQGCQHMTRRIESIRLPLNRSAGWPTFVQSRTWIQCVPRILALPFDTTTLRGSVVLRGVHRGWFCRSPLTVLPAGTPGINIQMEHV